MRFVIVPGLVAVLLAACGPGPTPETPKPGSDAGAAAPAADAGTAEASSPLGNAEQSKRAFMTGCMRGGEGLEPFCDCAWNEIRAVVGDQKMNTEGPSAQDLVASHGRVMSACKSKMTEDAVKGGYMQGCIGDRAEMKDYCDCSWTEFRKDFSPGDLGDESVISSDKFAAARTKVVKVCGPKISEKVVKEGFIKACTRDPKLDKFCSCAWDEVRKTASPAEIEAGMIDNQKVRASIDKVCAKQRPTQ